METAYFTVLQSTCLFQNFVVVIVLNQALEALKKVLNLQSIIKPKSLQDVILNSW